MILRLLIFAGLAWLAWQFLQQWQRKLRGPSADDRDSEPKYQLTSRCTRCGNYLPSESLSKSGRCGRCSD